MSPRIVTGLRSSANDRFLPTTISQLQFLVATQMSSKLLSWLAKASQSAKLVKPYAPSSLKNASATAITATYINSSKALNLQSRSIHSTALATHDTRRTLRTQCTMASLTDTSGVLSEDWPEHDFVKVAEACLEHICETVSTIADGSENSLTDFDVDFSQGVLTIQLAPTGTYVLNTQTPNRQIWLSSPSSGPWRYAWQPQRSEWISARDGHALAERLSTELSEIFEKPVSITFNGLAETH